MARVRLALLRRWTELRAVSTDRLEARRIAMGAPLDRFTTAFWRRIMGHRSWRRLDPTLWDWELAYGPVIDSLKPDIIHANDFRMVGVGARAATRARARGRDVRLVWDAHEFLPGMRPWNPHPRWHVAQLAHEREYAPLADAVVTVSDVLADLLVAEHGLTEPPTVVLNAPELASDGVATDPTAPSIRASCGLADDVPLLVYSGSAAAPRGLEVMVESLALLPEAHVALVVSQPKSAYVKGLRQRANDLGVTDRLHVLDYVPVPQIVGFLASADVGVIPILHFPNHEISLITKFLEYSQARLPIVVSDVKAMAATVRATGQGEVFAAGSVEDFARAVTVVLDNPEAYRTAYDQPDLLPAWTWEAAADTLDGVYSRLRAEQLARSSPDPAPRTQGR
ncbi:MAG: glycosyltransferase family 4 protein [Propionibacteriaceae bacterium]